LDTHKHSKYTDQNRSKHTLGKMILVRVNGMIKSVVIGAHFHGYWSWNSDTWLDVCKWQNLMLNRTVC